MTADSEPTHIPFGTVGCDRWIYMTRRVGVETGALEPTEDDPAEWSAVRT
jgi:hypothetical protein